MKKLQKYNFLNDLNIELIISLKTLFNIVEKFYFNQADWKFYGHNYLIKSFYKLICNHQETEDVGQNKFRKIGYIILLYSASN
ncbi:3494_t:CDS:2 [Gigaspora margarita]|uniref:3494_t:CDS:1 n=1 Tax=Gigaspora margarita TaxID=4874 RepID=A0ABN7UQJ1_GIGMA|nr:3494_t:CDS:2 [Gigaspora margarita]